MTESKTARELGQHSFRLALRPHKGSWSDAMVWQTSAEHRLPLIGYPLKASDAYSGNGLQLEASMLTIAGMDLMLSCYKLGETSNELIVRLYETIGVSGNANLDLHRELEKVELIDLCERTIGELSFQGSIVTIPIDAHSIVTLRVKLRN